MLLYIDPGTGSMLFTVLLGLLTTVYFFAQKLMLKVKLYFSGGKSGKIDTHMIPYVIFVDDKRYWEMFKGVCELFEEKATELVYWTCSKDDPALDMHYKYVKAEYIGNLNAASVRLNRMKAGICIATTPGLDVYQWKRSKDTRWYVHLMHGAGDARAYRMFGLDFFDAVLVTGDHQKREIRQIEEIRKEQAKEVVEVGEPHIDSLYNRAVAENNIEKKGVTVLLAPSWGASAIFSKYGEKIIDALLATDYYIIIRPHPQSMSAEKELMDGLMNKYPDNDRLEWNFDNDNFEALSRADIMISDFSAVMWDYLFVFGRPLIYADVDLDDEPYDMSWVDEKRWEMGILPKVGMKLEEESIPELGSLIDKAINSSDISRNIEEVKKDAWVNPGESSSKIVEYLINKYDELEIS